MRKCEIEVFKNETPIYRTCRETATDAFNEFMDNFVKPKRYKLRLSENDQVIFHTDPLPLHEAVMALTTYLVAKYAISPLFTGSLKAKV